MSVEKFFITILFTLEFLSKIAERSSHWRNIVFKLEFAPCVFVFFAEMLGIFKRHWLTGISLCTYCRWTYSRLAKRIHTNQSMYYFRGMETQRVRPSNAADLALPVNLCCVSTFLASFQISHEVNIRLPILSGVTWNPIVLSRQFRWRSFRGQVKKICSAVSLSLQHSVYASYTSWSMAC